MVAVRAHSVLAIRLPARRLVDIGPEAREARVIRSAVGPPHRDIETLSAKQA